MLFGGSELKMRCLLGLIATMTVLFAPSIEAQWKTESFRLRNGWNAIYMQVDVRYADLQTLLDNTGAGQVQEVWLWAPTFTTREFLQNPDSPTNVGSNWLSWQRNDPGNATLGHLLGDAAYLIHYTGPDDLIWNVTGIPVPPVYKWSSAGENFLGFSTPASGAPSFEDFLGEEPSLPVSIDIFRYVGGPLGSNPVQVLGLRNSDVVRGEAFWLKASNFNSYFGPFDLSLQRSAGIDFGGNAAQSTVRIRNRADRELTVTFELLDSGSPPAQVILDSGDPTVTPNSLPGVAFDASVAGTPPIVVRGVLDPNTRTFPFTSLVATPHSVTLAPEGELGSEMDVVLGVDISSLSGVPGDLFAGVIRFTDSLGHLQVDVPTRVIQKSMNGLWVGEAKVRQVMNSPTVSTTQTLGSTSTPAPLRLIVHHGQENATTTTRLLQRVYFGFDDNVDPLLTIREDLLSSEHLSAARRLSATHLPWTEGNDTWAFDQDLESGGAMTAVVSVEYDDQRTNPFLHTYHPDHDNKDALFENAQPRGEESYTIKRDITLTLDAGGGDFDSVTRAGSQEVSGIYDEAIEVLGKGTESTTFQVRGEFSLNRITLGLPLLQHAP